VVLEKVQQRDSLTAWGAQVDVGDEDGAVAAFGAVSGTVRSVAQEVGRIGIELPTHLVNLVVPCSSPLFSIAAWSVVRARLRDGMECGDAM
jgi:hypothetical protein